MSIFSKTAIMLLSLLVYSHGSQLYAAANPHRLTSSISSSQMAIIIDDLGNNQRGSTELFKIKAPLTIAIMPFLKTSQSDAIRASLSGFQVILHLPMESVRGSKNWLGPGAILTNMSDTQIKTLVKKEIESVPFVVGINNHMGSKATASKRVVKDILEVVKEKHLFIVDSVTTSHSQFANIASQMGIPYAKRTVFLDNENNLSRVKKQIQLLIDYAHNRGDAIGIGHVGVKGVNTCQGIKEMLPQIRSSGVAIVPVSTIVKVYSIQNKQLSQMSN